MFSSPSASVPVLPTILQVKFCSCTDKSLQVDEKHSGKLRVGAQSFGSPFVPSPHTNTDLLSTQSVMSSQNSLRQAASIAITQSMAFKKGLLIPCVVAGV